MSRGSTRCRRSGVTDKALKVGDQAPDFELLNAAGKKVKLSELTARGPVVTHVVSRWLVPLLNIALRGFHKASAGDPGRRRTLVALSPETPDNTLSTAREESPRFGC